MYKALGYKTNLTYQDYYRRYRRGGLARRLIRVFPEAVWGIGAEIIEDPNPGVITKFESAVYEKLTKLDFWKKVRIADILSRIGHYSVILIGAPGELTTPLENVADAEIDSATNSGSIASKILYLRPFAEDRAKILTYDEDIRSIRYGLPLTYKINTSKRSTNGKLVTNKSDKTNYIVHWSRIIHVTMDPLDDELNSDPMLEAGWNDFDDLLKLGGGMAEAQWCAGFPGMHVDYSPDVDVDEDDADEQVSSYFDRQDRWIRTRGGKVKVLASSTVDVSNAIESKVDLIAGTYEIPKRKLLGSERGELSSAQDEKNFNKRISNMRFQTANPIIEYVVDLLVAFREVPAPNLSTPYTILWPDSEELDEEQKAKIALLMAQTNQANGTRTFTEDEIRQKSWNLGPLEEQKTTGDTRRVANRSLSTNDNVSVLKKVLQKNSVALEDVVFDFFDGIRNEISEQDLESPSTVLDSLDSTLVEEDKISKFRQSIEESLSQSMADSGSRLLKIHKKNKSWWLSQDELDELNSTRELSSRLSETDSEAVQFLSSFNAVNPRAVSYAVNSSSALVKEISQSTREAVQLLISDGTAEGIAPRKLAQLVRQCIGLRSDQVRAILKLRKDILSAKPGDLITRFPPREGVRVSAGFKIKIPKNLTDEWIEKKLEKYATMSHNYRARTVSRTETMRAANAGQEELWKQAIDEGLLDKNQEKIWIDTPDARCRKKHKLLHGRRAKVGRKFKANDGSMIDPGEEVHCRCGCGLVRPERKAA